MEENEGFNFQINLRMKTVTYELEETRIFVI